MNRRKIQFEALDSRNMLTSLAGDTVEMEDHRYADGGIFTITVTVIDDDTAEDPITPALEVIDHEVESAYPQVPLGWRKVSLEWDVNPDAADALYGETNPSDAPGD